MKKTRIALVVLALLAIGSVVCMGSFSQAVQDGRMAKDWMGVFGLLMTGAVVANAVLSFRYAWGTGRQAVLWAVGALLLPYIVPFILALLTDKTKGVEIQTGGAAASDPPVDSSQAKTEPEREEPKALFTSIPKTAPVFDLKDGMFRSSQWRLDRLRIFCIVLPGSFKWYGVISSQKLNFIFPDLLPAKDADSLYRLLETLSFSSNPNELSGIRIFLAGFEGEGGGFELDKLKRKSAALMAGLYHYRNERTAGLKKWLDGKPRITLRGGLGSQAVLDGDGFHKKKLSLSWKEVDKINTEETNGMVAHLYVLPKERSGGLFDLKKGKYALARIPVRKRELYAAECFFWKTCCG
jgi:hypothetical protein